METEPENLTQLQELWNIYMKMPVRTNFDTLEEYDAFLFAWSVTIENKFHDFKIPANHFKNTESEEKNNGNKIAIPKLIAERKETDIHVCTATYSRIGKSVVCPDCQSRTYFH